MNVYEARVFRKFSVQGLVYSKWALPVSQIFSEPQFVLTEEYSSYTSFEIPIPCVNEIP